MKITLICAICALFLGCAREPKIIYKQVLTPVKCAAQMPLKPRGDESFESHKELMKYFVECESVAKYCTGGDYGK